MPTSPRWANGASGPAATYPRRVRHRQHRHRRRGRRRRPAAAGGAASPPRSAIWRSPTGPCPAAAAGGLLGVPGLGHGARPPRRRGGRRRAREQPRAPARRAPAHGARRWPPRRPRATRCARRLMRDEARWLGVGFANLLHLYSPERVILGGGVAWLEMMQPGDRAHGPDPRHAGLPRRAGGAVSARAAGRRRRGRVAAAGRAEMSVIRLDRAGVDAGRPWHRRVPSFRALAGASSGDVSPPQRSGPARGAGDLGRPAPVRV